MSRPDLATVIEKTHPHHAKLIRSNSGSTYLHALGHPHWEQEVRTAFGNEFKNRIGTTLSKQNQATRNDWLTYPTAETTFTITHNPFQPATIEHALQVHDLLELLTKETRSELHNYVTTLPLPQIVAALKTTPFATELASKAVTKKQYLLQAMTTLEDEQLPLLQPEIDPLIPNITWPLPRAELETKIRNAPELGLGGRLYKVELEEKASWLQNPAYITPPSIREIIALNLKASPQHVLDASLTQRKAILDAHYSHLQFYHDLAEACEQLPERKQDPFILPRLTYPVQLENFFLKAAQHLTEVLADMPDIDDITVPKRRRNKTTNTYSLREMDKNPLDIKFGNDAGCCLALTNGHTKKEAYTIPYFLTEPLHLFEIVRHNATAHRVGFIPAYKTLLDERPILAVNSIELSQHGIPGGRAAKQQLIREVQQFLTTYAHDNGFHGVAMGAHEENPGIRYAPTHYEPVQHPLTLRRHTNTANNLFAGSKTTKYRSLVWLHKPTGLNPYHKR